MSASPTSFEPGARARETLERMWSRRRALAAGVGAVAALAASRTAKAATAGGVRGTRRGTSHAATDDLYKLVLRTSHGFARDLWDEVRERGWDDYLKWQLEPERIVDTTIDGLLPSYPSLVMTSRQIQDAYVNAGQPDVPATELATMCVLRAAFSKRQLFERVVELWTDHFNVDHGVPECGVLKTTDDRDVIRAHALGTFPDMLRASARSGAMLVYLDNYSNQAAGVNENYARELLELHTLSPGHYTEDDVRQLAQVLTGWTVWRPSDPAYGTFRFRRDWHATGTYTVLGRTYGPNGGQADFEAVLGELVAHPATARFVAFKLCRRFLADEPEKRVVDDVAREYVRTGGDVKAMLRVVLRPENVLAGTARPKLKRPFTFLVSVLRATRATVATPQTLLDELDLLGQVPYRWGPPDGYPDTSKYWGKSILARWSFAARLFDGAIPGLAVDTAAIFQNTAPADAAKRCDKLFAGGNLHPQDVAEIDAYVAGAGAFTIDVQREALALAASSPSFQEV